LCKIYKDPEKMAHATLETGPNQFEHKAPPGPVKTGLDRFWNQPKPVVAVRTQNRVFLLETYLISWKTSKLLVE
jgi:hypothetical protein